MTATPVGQRAVCICRVCRVGGGRAPRTPVGVHDAAKQASQQRMAR